MKSILRSTAVALATIVAAPVGAQTISFCEEAWLVRNMIFDRLGHCFSSQMGQILFDNSNCTVTGPTPPPALAQDIQRIREGENHVGCQINTAQAPSAAMYRFHAVYQNLIDLPAPDYLGGYACWGYRGPDFRLLAGASMTAPEVGIARTGQSVVLSHWPGPNGWVYGSIVTGPDGALVTEGWFAGVDLSDGNCDLVAG